VERLHYWFDIVKTNSFRLLNQQ